MVNKFYLAYISLNNGQKVFSRMIYLPWGIALDPLLIVVLFDSSVPFGMVKVNLE